MTGPAGTGAADEGGVADPLDAVTGDPQATALLRRNLETLADTHRDTPVGDLVRDVLDGRRPVEDLREDPGFTDLVRTGVDQYRAYLASLSPEQRRALDEEAERLTDGT